MTQRPAESGGVAGALALLVAHLFGVNDATVIVSLAVVVGFVPAAITWLIVTFKGKPSTPTPTIPPPVA